MCLSFACCQNQEFNLLDEIHKEEQRRIDEGKPIYRYREWIEKG